MKDGDQVGRDSKLKTTETRCRYCDQELFNPTGAFECGGEGEGICSFWDAIGDYDKAGRPENIEGWLGGWIQDVVGTDWESLDWDRDAHARAIRDHFKLVTVDTITDEQILKLFNDCEIAAIDLTVATLPGWSAKDRQETRAKCAKVFNALATRRLQ